MLTTEETTDTSASQLPSGSRLTKTQKRARLRKRKAEVLDPDGHEVSAIQLANSIPWRSEHFNTTSAIHAKDGYIGQRDGGTDFDFLDGDIEKQISQLHERAYSFLDPPPQ